MKKILVSLLLILATLESFAQAPTEVPFILVYLDTVSRAMRPVRLYQEHASGSAVAKFNFGPAGTTAIDGYTGVYGDPRTGVLTASAGGVTITTIQNYPLWSAGAFSFSSGNTGHSTGNNSGARPDSVWVGNFFRYNQTFVDTATSKCFLVSGLTPGATYVVKTGGSRELSGTTDPHQLGACEFRVMGVAQTLNTDNNTATVLTFNNVQADANGCISVFVGQISGTTHYGFISFLEIYTP